MLKVTAEFWPGGREGDRMALVAAKIEELPLRPRRLDAFLCIWPVPLRKLMETARSLFRKRILYWSRPVIEVDPIPMDCAHSWDWFDFLAGGR